MGHSLEQEHKQLIPVLTITPDLHNLIDRALAEDIGTGDVTTESVVAPTRHASARIYTRQSGIIAGLPIARLVFARFEPSVQFTTLVEDGTYVEPNAEIVRLEGSARAILTAERTALNFLGRLSGIATLTAQAVQILQDVPASRGVIVDTRKTTPGLRGLEKYAVRVGGGQNHRTGLYDGVLIKENHLRAAGGVIPAVRAAKAHAHHLLKVEVEVETLAEVRQAIEAGADIILLDNMDTATMHEAVTLIAGKAKVEASGNMRLERLAEVAATGVDLISMGALTHSAPNFDFSLEFVLSQLS